MSDQDFRERLARVDALVAKLEALPDAVARETARELVSTVLELHARGLSRLLDLERTPERARELAKERDVSDLLLLHGLHPVPLEERVRSALTNSEPQLARRASSAELLSLEGGVVRVRLSGEPSLAAALEQAIWELAPDATRVELEVAPRVPASPLVTLRIPGKTQAESSKASGA